MDSTYILAAEDGSVLAVLVEIPPAYIVPV